MIKACIFTIGDEILLGQITDTNARFIAETLTSIGIEVVAKLTIGDSRTPIWQGLEFAFQRADVVIVTGGLGPTKDDLTKALLAEWFQSEMAIHTEALTHLEDLLRRRGREINDLTRAQAIQPVKSEYLRNEVGTAPGMWFAENGKTCIALPGVPYEMKQILVDEVVPRLKARLNLGVILHQFIRTVGVPESTLAQRIEVWEDALPDSVKLAYLPGGGQVKLRLTGRGEDETTLRTVLKEQTNQVLPLIEEFVYATEDVELETLVAQLIQNTGIVLNVQDELSEGVLFQKFGNFPLIQKMLLSNESLHADSPELARILLVWDSEKLTQVIQAKMGSISRYLEIKPFPHPDVNRHVISLAALNLLRKIILEKWPKV